MKGRGLERGWVGGGGPAWFRGCRGAGGAECL